MAEPWRFYVYQLFDECGKVAYVGKGSGRRLAAQQCIYKRKGVEVARFKREKDAYAYEVQRIADEKPYLNKCAGGNGSYADPIRRPRTPKWAMEMQRVGIRAYAAQLLLRYDQNVIQGDKLDDIRRIAYG